MEKATKVTRCFTFSPKNRLAGLWRQLLEKQHQFMTPSRNSRLIPQTLKLAASNSSSVHTNDYRQIDMSFGLQGTFFWHIVIADISIPILSTDFLWHYGMLVDLNNRPLIAPHLPKVSRKKLNLYTHHSFHRFLRSHQPTTHSEPLSLS